MTKAQQNLALVALLVVVLAVAGYALRDQSAPTGSAPTPATSSSPSGSHTTGSPTPTPSASGSASPSGSVSPSSTAIKTVAFLGDSFTAGVGASAPAKRWSTVVATAHGWTEQNFGHPQSGYVSTGTTGPCAAANSCPDYLSQVPAVIAAAPELVIISGGGNDVFLDPATVTSHVNQTIAGLRAGLPHATIVVINPWWDMRPVPASLATVTENVKAAAAADAATWADTGQPIVGKVDLVTSDGLQANDAGHAAMAAAVEGALKLAQITQ